MNGTPSKYDVCGITVPVAMGCDQAVDSQTARSQQMDSAFLRLS